MHQTPILCALLVIVLLALAAGTGQAVELSPQLSRPPEVLVDAFLEGVAGRVALSPEEHAAVRSLLIEQTKKRQEIARARLAANPGRAGLLALREDMRALSRETDTKLAAVLPPEKVAILSAYRDELRQQARARVQTAASHGS